MADRPAPLTDSSPHTWRSMTAAAQVVTSRSVKLKKPEVPGQLDWQDELWTFFDTVGEMRSGVTWQANALSRINLVAARPPQQVGDEPVALSSLPEDEITPAEARAMELVESFAGGAIGQGQLLHAFGMQIPVGGLSWIVAEPDPAQPNRYGEWCAYSQRNVKVEVRNDQQVWKVATGKSGAEAWRVLDPNALVIKVWRRHPDRPWEPDTPLRAALPILEQIDLLSSHINATAQSRLAGAGVLFLPSEAEFPPPPQPDQQEGDADPDEYDPLDYWIDQLVDMMLTARKDKGNAAAVVPYVSQIPGEFIQWVKHISFATPFDDHVLPLLEAAIRRLALSMDMPPEVLLGLGDLTHWNAWQVSDEAITLHTEPQAEMFCHGVTDGYLVEALVAEGYPGDSAMVWYDTSDLTTPPDRSDNVVAAYDRREASGQALRRHLGLEDEDAPSDDETKRRALLAYAEAVPEAAPAVLVALNIIDEAEAARLAAAAPQPATAVPPPAPSPADDDDLADGPPEVPPDARDRPEAADAAILAAADGIVYRALERAGNRLKSKIGKRADAGAVVHDDPATLHTLYDPSIYADFDYLLAGSFDRAPEVASWVGLDGELFSRVLEAYCRSLLVNSHAHDRHRLAGFLGTERL